MNDSVSDSPSYKKAVALHNYKQSEAAPKIVASGSGLVAEKILALAKEHDIYIHEDPDLVHILTAMDVNSEVPEHLYKSVAEILAFVYQLNRDLLP